MIQLAKEWKMFSDRNSVGVKQVKMSPKENHAFIHEENREKTFFFCSRKKTNMSKIKGVTQIAVKTVTSHNSRDYLPKVICSAYKILFYLGNK